MPFYSSIKWMDKAERKRTVDGLVRLREQLDDDIPRKTAEDTLILGTWNIRNFDDNRFANGTRSREDLFYIAEIISRFDILAVQEVCEDLGPLKDVMRILGRDRYDYILTDKTEGRAGNEERLGFIYDRSKVEFKGVAGELVLPDNMLIVSGERKLQFSRTPFMCQFQSGWFKFAFSTVHIYFGSDSGEKFERRVDEIEAVAEFLAKRAKKDEVNHILVGDFNIPKHGDEAFNALTSAGFTAFQNRKGSNAPQTKFYDQISFLSEKGQVMPVDGANSHGVVQFFNSVLRPEDFLDQRSRLIEAQQDKIENAEAEIENLKGKIDRARSNKSKQKYQDAIEEEKLAIAAAEAVIASDVELKKYYLDTWRTFHMSDHLPLWVELKIDFSGDYLEGLAMI